MSGWIIKGLKSGVVSTHYPDGGENAQGVSPGLPSPAGGVGVDTPIGRCPTSALKAKDGGAALDKFRCVHCHRCDRNVEPTIPWDSSYEWAEKRGKTPELPKAFQRSTHIRVLDAGDCGACLNEMKLLNNPFYNMHRLGFFITPTPRQADLLVVLGPVADHMKTALLKAYEAMPAPKKVMSVGTCSATGGVFEDGFMTSTKLEDIIPVDVVVPGCPPPPLAILHGLLLVTGREDEIRSDATARPAADSSGKEAGDA